MHCLDGHWHCPPPHFASAAIVLDVDQSLYSPPFPPSACHYLLVDKYPQVPPIRSLVVFFSAAPNYIIFVVVAACHLISLVAIFSI
jgi:hypothetical protein